MQTIIEKCGGPVALRLALGVTSGAIRKAVAGGIFPASWYFVITGILGEEPPRALFSFREVDNEGRKVVRSGGSGKGAAGAKKSRAAAGKIAGGKSAARPAPRRKEVHTEGEA